MEKTGVRMLLEKRIVDILREEPSGITALGLLGRLAERYGMDYVSDFKYRIHAERNFAAVNEALADLVDAGNVASASNGFGTTYYLLRRGNA
ncbi:MAG: hypothetical protein M1160_02005 [Candidatus Marsarchaeota archaeon]|jgi:hypothetical protein|nr:hypothetical protein [Candidatus Marsarchaeota archaeon]MCL5111635.1 hypothetical protein [Candidatus Marsarchaeota archaeon]